MTAILKDGITVEEITEIDIGTLRAKIKLHGVAEPVDAPLGEPLFGAIMILISQPTHPGTAPPVPPPGGP